MACPFCHGNHDPDAVCPEKREAADRAEDVAAQRLRWVREVEREVAILLRLDAALAREPYP